MAAPEHRAGTEFRIAGRTLSGRAMLYGDVSPSFRERFTPGAFGTVPATIPVNLQHDSSIIVAERAVLADTPRELRVRADLPEGSAALALVRRGALNSFSIEFFAREERREAGVRVIERADLVGLSLVDEGAYRGATAEVRRALLEARAPSATIGTGREGYGNAWARAHIAADKRPKSCKCLPGESKCRRVRFKPGAFDRTVREVEAGRHDVIAHTGSYRPSDALGDTRTRALILTIAGPESPEVAAGSLLVFLAQRVIGTIAGNALEASLETAPPVVRPLIDDEKSEFEDTFEDDESDGVRVYSDAWIDSVLIKYADDESAEGWDYLRPVGGGEVVSLDTTYPTPAPVPEPPSPLVRVPAWL